MITLTQRQIKTLQLLVENEDFKTMNYYASLLNVSERTLYNDIAMLESYLNKYEIIIEKKPRVGIRLLDSRNQLNQFIMDHTKNNIFNEYQTPYTRQSEIIKMLLIDGKTVSYQELSDLFLVSKSSIAKDFEFIQTLFLEESLKILSDKKGTRVEGNEYQIQKVLKKYIYYLTDEGYIDTDNCFSSLPAFLYGLFPDPVIKSIYQLIQQNEYTKGFMLPDDYFRSLIFSIIILVVRIMKGHHMSAHPDHLIFDDLKILKTYLLSEEMICVIEEQLDVKFDSHDKDYFNRQLVAHNIEPGLKDEMIVSQYKDLVLEMIEDMSLIMHVDLINDENLFNGLIYHIVPMVYRMKVGISIMNPLLEDIKKHYSVTLSATWYVITKLESILDISITEDEVAYIMVHFQVAIEKKTEVKNILVVCSTGIGTSELIALKIKRYLPTQDRVEVVPLRQLYESDITNVDFIISSVQIENINKPILYVSPLISNQDLIRISHFHSKMSQSADEIDDKEDYHFMHIGSFLERDLIFLNMELNSKEACIDYLIDTLNEKGYILEGFKKSLLDREKLGATSLPTGAAIPHASPDLVRESKICIMTLNRFIKWDKRTINTIILLCISEADIKRVKGVLSEIYRIVQSKGNIYSLLSNKNESEIYNSLGGGKVD